MSLIKAKDADGLVEAAGEKTLMRPEREIGQGSVASQGEA